MKHRLVRLRLDLAEAVHAAHVVHAVHDGAPGVLGNPVPIMESRVTISAKLRFAPAFGAFGPHRQHQKARLGGRIPDPDLGFLRQADAEIGEHAARILDGAGTIGRGLVPDRRQPQHFPGVTGAQRADDHVVPLRRVLDRDQMIADPADMAERADGLAGIRQQGLFEGRIGPGFRHDLRAIARADLGLIGLDDGVERGRVDIAFFGQDGFERAHAQLHLRQFRMVVIVIMVAHGAKNKRVVGRCRDRRALQSGMAGASPPRPSGMLAQVPSASVALSTKRVESNP